MPTPSRTADERELAYDIKFLLVVLLLFVFYPVGLILMWVWMPNWPTWLKALLSLPVFLFLFMIFVGMVFFVRLWHSGNTMYYRNGPMMRGHYYYNNQGGAPWGRMPMMPYNPNGGQNPPSAPSPSVLTPTVSPSVPNSY